MNPLKKSIILSLMLPISFPYRSHIAIWESIGMVKCDIGLKTRRKSRFFLKI